MLAQQALQDGNVDAALADLQQQVRSEPANAKHRIFLFQLLAVRGEWDRAMTQLKVVGEIDAGSLAMVQVYREAIKCEVFRSEVFEGKRSPLIFGEPAEWIAMLTESLRQVSDGKYEQSQELREQAFEGAPATAGTIDGQPFEWIADADSRMGPVLEAVVNGRYYWVPFQNISRLQFEEPADLRDIVWTPVFFTWANGGEAAGLIPTRYPGSASSEDPLVQLARKTDWIGHECGLYAGSGQRMLTTNSGDFPLMDIREITLETGVSGDGSEAPPTS